MKTAEKAKNDELGKDKALRIHDSFHQIYENLSHGIGNKCGFFCLFQKTEIRMRNILA